MKIGIIGAGNIGSTIAHHFLTAGHEVLIANSRGPETLGELIDELGQGASAHSADEVATHANLVMEAIPFKHIPSLPAEALKHKILITAANYYPDRDGEIDLQGQTQSQWVASHLPGVHVVKAFNTIYFEHLAEQADTGAPLDERRVIPVAADDEQARQQVIDLIERIGFGPLDCGGLADSTVMEPDSPIYNKVLTRAEARQIIAAHTA